MIDMFGSSSEPAIDLRLKTLLKKASFSRIEFQSISNEIFTKVDGRKA